MEYELKRLNSKMKNIINSTSLPPKVDGQLRRYVKVELSFQWMNLYKKDVSKSLAVKLLWWGEEGPGTIFKPLSETLDRKVVFLPVFYPLKSGPIQFNNYLKDMKVLGFEVLEEKVTIGRCVLTNLQTLRSNQPIKKFLAVINDSNHKIGNLKVHISIQPASIHSSSDPNCPTSEGVFNDVEQINLFSKPLSRTYKIDLTKDKENNIKNIKLLDNYNNNNKNNNNENFNKNNSTIGNNVSSVDNNKLDSVLKSSSNKAKQTEIKKDFKQVIAGNNSYHQLVNNLDNIKLQSNTDQGELIDNLIRYGELLRNEMVQSSNKTINDISSNKGYKKMAEEEELKNPLDLILESIDPSARGRLSYKPNACGDFLSDEDVVNELFYNSPTFKVSEEEKENYDKKVIKVNAERDYDDGCAIVEKEEMKRCESFGEEISGKMIDLVPRNNKSCNSLKQPPPTKTAFKKTHTLNKHHPPHPNHPPLFIDGISAVSFTINSLVFHDASLLKINADILRKYTSSANTSPRLSLAEKKKLCADLFFLTMEMENSTQLFRTPAHSLDLSSDHHLYLPLHSTHVTTIEDFLKNKLPNNHKTDVDAQLLNLHGVKLVFKVFRQSPFTSLKPRLLGCSQLQLSSILATDHQKHKGIVTRSEMGSKTSSQTANIGVIRLATKVLRDEKYTTHDVIKTEVKASSSSSEEECDDLFIGVMLPAMKIFEERLDQDEECGELNTYILLKCLFMGGDSGVLRSQVAWDSAMPLFNFCQILPIKINNTTTNSFKNNFLIVELWNKSPLHLKDQLLGICKLPLHQFYLSLHQPTVRLQTCASKLPVIAVDCDFSNSLESSETLGHHSPDVAHVVDVCSCSVVGVLQAAVFLGTYEQVVAYQNYKKRQMGGKLQEQSPQKPESDNAYKKQKPIHKKCEKRKYRITEETTDESGSSSGEEACSLEKKSPNRPVLPTAFNKLESMLPVGESCKIPEPSIDSNFPVNICIERAYHIPRQPYDSGLVDASCYVTYMTSTGSICTAIQPNTANPCWLHERQTWLPRDVLTTKNKNLIFKVWHKPPNATLEPDKQRDVVVGFVSVDLRMLKSLPCLKGCYQLINLSGLCQGQLKISVTPLEVLQDNPQFRAAFRSHAAMTPTLLPPTMSSSSSSSDGLPLKMQLNSILQTNLEEMERITKNLKKKINIINDKCLVDPPKSHRDNFTSPMGAEKSSMNDNKLQQHDTINRTLLDDTVTSFVNLLMNNPEMLVSKSGDVDASSHSQHTNLHEHPTSKRFQCTNDHTQTDYHPLDSHNFSNPHFTTSNPNFHEPVVSGGHDAATDDSMQRDSDRSYMAEMEANETKSKVSGNLMQNTSEKSVMSHPDNTIKSVSNDINLSLKPPIPPKHLPNNDIDGNVYNGDFLSSKTLYNEAEDRNMQVSESNNVGSFQNKLDDARENKQNGDKNIFNKDFEDISDISSVNNDLHDRHNEADYTSDDDIVQLLNHKNTSSSSSSPFTVISSDFKNDDDFKVLTVQVKHKPHNLNNHATIQDTRKRNVRKGRNVLLNSLPVLTVQQSQRVARILTQNMPQI